MPDARQFPRPLFLLLLFLSPSCSYLTDRGLDFVDQFRAVTGVSTGGGLRINAAGLVHTGVTFGIKPHPSTLGLNYGRVFLLTAGPFTRFDADQSIGYLTTSYVDCNYEKGEYKLSRASFALLPAVFSWVDSAPPNDSHWHVPDEGVELEGEHWIWSAHTTRYNRYAQIHAFDVEFELGIFAYIDLGYSPGETLDFVLGIFTIDLADDDGR